MLVNRLEQSGKLVHQFTCIQCSASVMMSEMTHDEHQAAVRLDRCSVCTLENAVTVARLDSDALRKQILAHHCGG